MLDSLRSKIVGVEALAGSFAYLSHDELLIRLYDRLPKELLFIRELTLSSLWRSPEHWDISHE